MNIDIKKYSKIFMDRKKTNDTIKEMSSSSIEWIWSKQVFARRMSHDPEYGHEW